MTPGVRFYSSSLLLIREGDSDTMHADIKLIDFANSSLYDAPHPEHDKVDEGYLFGLRNLIRMLGELKETFE